MIHTPSNDPESIKKLFLINSLIHLIIINFLFLSNQTVHHQFQISLRMDLIICLSDHFQYRIHLILVNLLVLKNSSQKLSEIELIVLELILLTKILIV